MNYTLEIKEEAANEINAAFAWYEERRKDLGLEFVSSLQKYLFRITENPLLFPESRKEERVVVMKRFPYKIIYGIEEKSIVIYAVFHTSRSPKGTYK